MRIFIQQRIVKPAILAAGVFLIGGVIAYAAPSSATVMFNIPFHRQEHSLSCEVASLKNAFYGYGLDVPESELIRFLEFDPTLKSGNVWGDPERGFVGSIDGIMPVNGYGVYADPIARLGLRWKRTEALRGGTSLQLAEHLLAGRPVIVWGYYAGLGEPMSWQTPEGKHIDAVHGEHTFLVYGFTGDTTQPTGFYVIDPINGHAYWDINYFLMRWDSLGRMAVVVYPYPKWMRAENDTKVWEISKEGTMKQWINMSWEEFVQRGGYLEAVHVVSPQELDRFAEGSPIL